MRPIHGVVLAAAAVVAGCVHDSEGHLVRTGTVRFDAKSVSTPNQVITLNADGTWGATRLQVVDDKIQSGFSAVNGGYAHVQIDRLPNGVTYTPSMHSAPVWTFVTEDGKAIPSDLEVPLYLAAINGMGGHWVNAWKPAENDRGPQLYTACAVLLFEIQGRQVAGWRQAYRGAECPAQIYPGRETLARLIDSRNEVWESPERSLP